MSSKAVKTTLRKRDSQRGIVWLTRYLEGLDDETEVELSIDKAHKRRSLNANAYAWSLLDKLAFHYGVSSEWLYRDMLSNVGGHSEYASIVPAALPMIENLWESRGLGWQVRNLGEHDGQLDIELSYGSSVFDTKQMSRLIDLIVQECKTAEIETMNPAELQSLIDNWKGENHDKGRSNKSDSGHKK